MASRHQPIRGACELCPWAHGMAADLVSARSDETTILVIWRCWLSWRVFRRWRNTPTFPRRSRVSTEPSAH